MSNIFTTLAKYCIIPSSLAIFKQMAKKVKMLTVKEVVEKTGIAHSTVSLYCRTKKFPNAVKEETVFGAFWMIPETDLKFVEKRKAGRPKISNN